LSLEELAVVGYGVGLLPVALHLLGLGRHPLTAGSLWALAWAVAFLAAAPALLESPSPRIAAGATFAGVAFPGLLLAGAVIHAGRVVPRAALVALAAFAGLVAFAASQGLEAEARALGDPVEALAVALAAGVVAWSNRGQRVTWGERLLPVGLLAITSLEVADATAAGAGPVLAGWLAVGPVVFILHFAAHSNRMRRGMESERAQRREAEERLRRSERRYFDHYEKSPGLFASLDAHSSAVLECNRRLCETLGERRDRLRGAPFHGLCAPSARPAFRQVFHAFRESGYIRDAELVLQRRDGSEVPVLLSASAERDSDGKVLFARCVLHNMSAWNADVPERHEGPAARPARTSRAGSGRGRRQRAPTTPASFRGRES